jgi:hypothetical protein
LADWLLIETFGGDRPEPTVMAIGGSPRNLVPLGKVLGRGRYLNDVRALVARVAAAGTALHTATTDGQRRMIGEPLKTLGGRVHGVYVWVGRPDEQPPPRDAAGAWHVNLTRRTSNRSDELFELYGIPPENRKYVVSLAQLFGYNLLQTNNDEATALAKLVNSKPGDEHQATWTVNRVADGVKRAANFAFRTIAETNGDGDTEVIARGITHDIGPAYSIPAAPPPQPVLLAQQVVAAEQTPGRWRAIFDLRTMTLLRWLDDPVPGIAWELESPYPPGIHRRDLRTVVRMSEALASSGRVTAELRFRAMDGGWMRLSVTANLMLLDQHTTAALVTLALPDDDIKIN